MGEKRESVSIGAIDTLKESGVEEGSELRLSVGTQLVLMLSDERIFALRSRKRGTLSLPGETAKSEDFSPLLNSFTNVDFQEEEGKEGDMRMYLHDWTYGDIEDLLAGLQATDPEILAANAKRGIFEELLEEDETAVAAQYKGRLHDILEEAFSSASVITAPMMYVYDSNGTASLGVQFGIVVNTENEELPDILNTLSVQGKGYILGKEQVDDLTFGKDVVEAALKQ